MISSTILIIVVLGMCAINLLAMTLLTFRLRKRLDRLLGDERSSHSAAA